MSPLHAPSTLEVPDYWTPEQALAVFELLTDLTDRLWSRYELEIIEQLADELRPDDTDQRPVRLRRLSSLLSSGRRGSPRRPIPESQSPTTGGARRRAIASTPVGIPPATHPYCLPCPLCATGATNVRKTASLDAE